MMCISNQIMKKIFSFLVGLVIFSVLPIIGWGVKDISGFFHNPYRIAFIFMMAILSGVVVLVVPNEGRGYGEGEKTVKRQKLVILILQIVPLLMVLFSPCLDRYSLGTFQESNTLRITGLILSLIGFWLMNWSVAVLGMQFSVDVTIQDGHQLITSGPYKYIRHPRYLGIILFLTGIPLVFRTWIPLLIDVFLVLILLWRISDEEKLMRQEFKGEWDDYKKRSRALIPFIY